MKRLITVLSILFILPSARGQWLKESKRAVAKVPNLELTLLAQENDLLFVSPSSTPCSPPPFIPSAITAFVTQSSEAVENMLCHKNVEDIVDPYSPQYCEQVGLCASTKQVKFFSEKTINSSLRQIIADDYALSELKKNINGMERVESLNKYMLSKFNGKLKLSCPDKFQDDLGDHQCNGRINRIFKDLQSKCSLGRTECYRSDVKGLVGFDNFEKNHQSENAFSAFFTLRTDANVREALKSEEKVTGQILTILNSNISKDEKKIQLKKMLQTSQADLELDPVLNYFVKSIIHNDTVREKRFDEFFTSVLDGPKEKMAERIEKLKLKIGEELVDESCNHFPSYESLCLDTENLIAGTKVDIDRKDLLERREVEFRQPDPKINQIMSHLKETDNNQMTAAQSARYMLEHARCQSFNLVDSSFYIRKPRISEKITAQLRGQTDKLLKLGSHMKVDKKEKTAREKLDSIRATQRLIGIEQTQEDPKYKNKTGHDISNKDFKSAQSNTNKEEQKFREPSEKLDIRSVDAQKNKFESSQPDKFTENKRLNNHSIIQQNNISRQEEMSENQIVTSEQRPQEKADKPLMPLQEKAEPIKEKEISHKKEEMKKDSLTDNSELYDLKKELGEIKNQMQVENKIVKETNVQQQSSNTYEDDVVSGIDIPTKNKYDLAGPDYVATGLKPTGDFFETGTSSTVNPAISHYNGSGLKLTEKTVLGEDKSSYALILTAQQGLSKEQKENSIVEKIKAMKVVGEFEILDEGVVYKVIPLLKDGKVVYENGKPKFDIEKVEPAKLRAPAELKRRQETDIKQISERAVYSKFKKASEAVLKKKNP